MKGLGSYGSSRFCCWFNISGVIITWRAVDGVQCRVSLVEIFDGAGDSGRNESFSLSKYCQLSLGDERYNPLVTSVALYALICRSLPLLHPRRQTLPNLIQGQPYPFTEALLGFVIACLTVLITLLVRGLEVDDLGEIMEADPDMLGNSSFPEQACDRQTEETNPWLHKQQRFLKTSNKNSLAVSVVNDHVSLAPPQMSRLGRLKPWIGRSILDNLGGHLIDSDDRNHIEQEWPACKILYSNTTLTSL